MNCEKIRLLLLEISNGMFGPLQGTGSPMFELLEARQLPDGSDSWAGVRFVLDDIAEPCDVLVVLNKLTTAVEVECHEVWQIVQEPPLSFVGVYLDLRRAERLRESVFTE